MSDLERRLEDLFMDESRSRKVQRVRVAPRRHSPLFVAFVAAGAAVVAVAVGLTLGSLRDARQEVAAPSASPGASPTAPAATPTGTAADGSEYASPLGYTVRLPSGWRRSELQSRTSTEPLGDPEAVAFDLFTDRTQEDEQRLIAARSGGTGLGQEQLNTAYVAIDRNSRRLDARAFAERAKGAFGFEAVSVEDTTFAGRPAAKTTWLVGAGDRRNFYAYYLADDSGRIWTVGFRLTYPLQEPPHDAREATLQGIVGSFRFATASASPNPAQGGAPLNEDFGIVTVVVQQPSGRLSAFVRGERDGRAFVSIGNIALTADGRPAGAVSPDGRRFAFWRPADPTGQATALVLWDAADPTKVTDLLRPDQAGGAEAYGDGVVWSSDGGGLLISLTSRAKLPGTPIRPEYSTVRTYELGAPSLGQGARENGMGVSPVAWDRARGLFAYVGLSGGAATTYAVVRSSGGNAARTPLEGAYLVTGSPDASWVVAAFNARDPGPGPTAYLRAWPLESPDRAVDVRSQSPEGLSHYRWRPGSREVGVVDRAGSTGRSGVLGGGRLALWDPTTGRRTDLAGDPGGPMAFRPDGTAVFVATSDGPARYAVHEIATDRRSDLAGCECAVVLRGAEMIVAGVRLR